MPVNLALPQAEDLPPLPHRSALFTLLLRESPELA